jgi:hypothetical protein
MAIFMMALKRLTMELTKNFDCFGTLICKIKVFIHNEHHTLI